MELRKIKNILECLLFVSEGALSVKDIRAVIEEADVEEITKALVELQEEYSAKGAIRVQEIAGGYRMLTEDKYVHWIRKLLKVEEESRLSRAALETLAIVAYKQPVVRAEIDAIRGVRSGSSIQSLLDRNLVRIVGRKDGPGRPFLYSITKEFLDAFGLRDISDLPEVEELKEETA